MKKSELKKTCIILTLLFISLTIPACGPRSISESSFGINSSAFQGVVFGAGALGQTYSVSEHGIFFLKNNKMQYFDLKAEESYVLCNQANCKHSDSGCNAWYENTLDATGLAMYGEKVYVLKLNSERNEYELIGMDITGTHQEIIHSLDIGNCKPDSWVLVNIGNVYYAGNVAWFTAQYQYLEQPSKIGVAMDHLECTILYGIDLKNGSIRKLNDLPQNKSMFESKQNPRYKFEFISEGYLMISKNWNALERLSPEGFHDLFEQGEFTEFSNSVDPYYEYLVWYQDNRELMFSYLLYNVSTGERVVFDHGKHQPEYGEDGHVAGYNPKYNFIGTYAEKLIYLIPDYEKNSAVYLFDASKNENEHILDIENGGALVTAGWGDVNRCIIDNEKILYCLYKEDEKAEIFYYDIAAKETVRLFRDEKNITFRMIGETSDKYIGIMYRGIFLEPKIYMIEKEDYYNGNLKEAEKLF